MHTAQSNDDFSHTIIPSILSVCDVRVITNTNNQYMYLLFMHLYFYARSLCIQPVAILVAEGHPPFNGEIISEHSPSEVNIVKDIRRMNLLYSQDTF